MYLYIYIYTIQALYFIHPLVAPIFLSHFSRELRPSRCDLRQRRGDALRGAAPQLHGAATHLRAALPQVVLLEPLQELQRGGEDHPGDV